MVSLLRICVARISTDDRLDFRTADTCIIIEIEYDSNPPPPAKTLPTSSNDKPSRASSDDVNDSPTHISSPSASETPKKIRAYLCEPFMPDNARLHKFSGSTHAGNNQGFAGNTADALAHFSVIATKADVLLADLQGM